MNLSICHGYACLALEFKTFHFYQGLLSRIQNFVTETKSLRKIGRQLRWILETLMCIFILTELTSIVY